MRTRLIQSAVVAVAAAGLVIATGPGAQASDGLHVVQDLSDAYVGPLQFAVHGHEVVVADAFTSTLNVIGRSAPIATGPSSASGGDVESAAIDPSNGDIAYSTSVAPPDSEVHTAADFFVLHHGRVALHVDLLAFEKAHNPDGRTTYGIPDPTQCQTDALTKLGFPVHYTGQVDSHPYAATALGHGAWAVADAGGNDVLRIDRWGHVSVIAVMPAQSVVVTQAFVDANAPGADCLVGATYRFEPVPTDVETSRSGLVVSLLPGGPEGPDSGNPGSVYVLHGHHPSLVAKGFASATNVAVTPSGRIFVAELGSGEIAEIVHGRIVDRLALPSVVGLEWANGHLYASTAPAATGGSGPGQVLELSRVG